MKKILIALAALGIFAAGPAAAATYIFDEVTDTYTFGLQGLKNGMFVDGTTARVKFSVLGIEDGGTDFRIKTEIENTSSGNTTSAGYTAFGLQVLNDSFLMSISNAPLFRYLSSGAISNGLNVDACAGINRQNCAGGGSDRLDIGETTTMEFLFQTADTTLTLFDPVLRVIDWDYGNVTGDSGLAVEGGGGPNTAVPEPATWALLILGFGSAGAMLRMERRRERRSLAHAA
jgi:hypothetical protein